MFSQRLPFGRLTAALVALCADESGQGLAEYAIVIALVAMIAIATLRALGRRVTNAFGSASNGFS